MAGGNIDVRVIFNEKVTVTGSPTLVLTNDTTLRWWFIDTLTATYQSGSSTNRLTFRVTQGAAATTYVADDVLSIGAQNIALAGGTIKDTGTTVNPPRQFNPALRKLLQEHLQQSHK